MKHTTLIKNPLFQHLRAFPATLFFILLLLVFVNPTQSIIYDFVFLLLSNLTNPFIFKPLSRILYAMFGVKDPPIIGRGIRPDGASCCGEFYDCDDLKKNKLSTSFGMPSGHSQCAWIFSSYFIYLLLQNKKTNNYVKPFQCSALIVFACLMAYSRVYVEGCHTIQQVIVGAIIGSIIGVVGGYFKTKHFKNKVI